MSTLFRALLVGCLAAAAPLRAVYAPIPEQDQGKDLVVSLKAGVSYDSNLFGAATDELGSTIFSFAPRLSYNTSLTDQTFFSAGYGLALDRFTKRPGDKLLDSHDALLRVAHAFSKTTTLDLVETLTIARNPESLLAGVPLSPDQSSTRNQLDGRFNTPLNAKATVTVKARSIYYKYRNAALGRSLDRIENLYGIAGDYAVLPEVKVTAEYRRQDVYYNKLGETKNKSSDYLMAGLDYDIAKKLSLSSRLGAERRRRAAERDVTSPYAELSGKYDYTESSFVVGGYAYTLEETSDLVRFTDTKVHRLFVNVQHSVTALIVASGSATYEPSKLQGRRGIADLPEETVRLGVALTYLPNKNWTVSASLDHDRVYSEDAVRDLRRNRAGLNVSYSF
jgi:hypothetical protein